MNADNDLMLILEGYKNTIELNLALSKQIQEILIQLVVLDKNLDILQKDQNILMASAPEIINILSRFKNTSDQCKKSITTILIDNNKEAIKHSFKIRLMIWIGYVGSLSIIATLATILMKLWGK